MVALTNESLAEALECCYFGFSRSIYVVFNNAARAGQFLREMQAALKGNSVPGVKSYLLDDRRFYRGEILFDTGSAIRVRYYRNPDAVLPYSRSADKIIYDEQVKQDPMLFSHLATYEMVPGDLQAWNFSIFSDHFGPELEVNSDELSDFLGSFGVHIESKG